MMVGGCFTATSTLKNESHLEVGHILQCGQHWNYLIELSRIPTIHSGYIFSQETTTLMDKVCIKCFCMFIISVKWVQAYSFTVHW